MGCAPTQSSGRAAGAGAPARPPAPSRWRGRSEASSRAGAGLPRACTSPMASSGTASTTRSAQAAASAERHERIAPGAGQSAGSTPAHLARDPALARRQRDRAAHQAEPDDGDAFEDGARSTRRARRASARQEALVLLGGADRDAQVGREAEAAERSGDHAVAQQLLLQLVRAGARPRPAGSSRRSRRSARPSLREPRLELRDARRG